MPRGESGSTRCARGSSIRRWSRACWLVKPEAMKELMKDRKLLPRNDQLKASTPDLDLGAATDFLVRQPARRLAELASLETPSSPLKIQMLSCLDAVKHAGGFSRVRYRDTGAGVSGGTAAVSEPAPERGAPPDVPRCARSSKNILLLRMMEMPQSWALA
jgi:hypothetical protein